MNPFALTCHPLMLTGRRHACRMMRAQLPLLLQLLHSTLRRVPLRTRGKKPYMREVRALTALIRAQF